MLHMQHQCHILEKMDTKQSKQSEQPNNVVSLQRPAPLPVELPFGTPSPEEAIIEILDYGKTDKKQ